MKKMLISSFDMEVGGVERSLLSMLGHFDYEAYEVDLHLHSHTGDLFADLPSKAKLLPELKAYKTFRKSIVQNIKDKQFPIVLARLLAKYRVAYCKSAESGYKQMQYMWRYTLPFLPALKQEYDVAISYLWPHDFVAEKVQAKIKIAWIHTDFSTIETDKVLDLKVWKQFNHIVAVSEECKQAFLRKYPSLADKTTVVENIRSPKLIENQANEPLESRMAKDNRFKIVTVARLSHAKGIDRAVQAFKYLKAKGHSNIAWYVVGYGGDEEMLQSLIQENNLENDFLLVGKKMNPYPYIKAADLYVQPSRYEGKAVTICEAQILAKPVLITNYPTAVSQVKSYEDGVICEASIEGIARGIEEMLHNSGLRSQLTSKCKSINYHNEKELEKLYELMN
ncbi:glycosyltransferase [Priestia flexa]|uniref:glycosyltransferase n=1 Tax=Priestia flexa TaxID=86664 RepID=UPI00240D70AB|nr:glycosyltransferase [Priestia flexa]WEZ07309.1 glycosyltransferase [Priestia flexa]